MPAFPMPPPSHRPDRSVSRIAVSLVVAGAALAGCASAPAYDAREAVVAAERGFARDAADRGIRAAFLAHFAPEGIAFEPGPIRLVEVWGARAAPADPRRLALAWEPAIAGVSSAGDLGYTSGPYTLSEPAGRGVLAHGVYFSVWRRDAGGVWRVALDAGIVTPEPVQNAALLPDPLPPRGDARPAMPDELADADRRLEGAASAYAVALAEDARWHVHGRAPVLGRDAVVAARAADARALRYTPGGAAVAASGARGLSYGRYEAIGRDAPPPAGHYAHLWRREPAGWRIVVAVHLE